jgi:hypothetical protein
LEQGHFSSEIAGINHGYAWSRRMDMEYQDQRRKILELSGPNFNQDTGSERLNDNSGELDLVSSLDSLISAHASAAKSSCAVETGIVANDAWLRNLTGATDWRYTVYAVRVRVKTVLTPQHRHSTVRSASNKPRGP